jgi:hypothetical protein
MIGGAQTIIHVPGDQPTIQAGIDAASTGDTVLVADGLYYENINFNGKDITLASHFLIDGDTNHINNAILDGSQPGNPNQGSVVYFISGEDTTSILCGFTIQNGTGHFPDAWNDRSGGGILLSESAAKIIHNKIISNTINTWAGAYGGGIAVNTMNDMWVVIRNNTISNNTTQSSQEKSEGGGVYTLCNAIIEDNIIEGNHCASTAPLYSDAKTFGGGVSMANYSNAPRYAYVRNNVIQNNVAEGLPRGGGMAFYKLNGVVSNNFIHGDTIISNFTQRGWGCGLYLDGTYMGMDMALTIEKNEISGNTFEGSYIAGGGIGMYDMELPFYINANIIRYNEATYGGGICSKLTYSVEITNNIVEGNEAALRGGGLFFTSNEFSSCEKRSDDRNYLADQSLKAGDRALFPLLVNNTITGNQSYLGGGLASEQTLRYLICFNSIFWDDNASMGGEIYLDDNCDLELHYCYIDTNLIHGPYSGSNNITGDPLFLDDSCHIDYESPCVNHGTNSLNITGTWYNCPAYDIDGEGRPFPSIYCDPVPDIGVDEIDFDCIGITTSVQNSEFSIQNYPNPFRENTTIFYELCEGTHVKITLFTQTGQYLHTLVDEKQPPGKYNFGLRLGALQPGIYFYQLTTPISSETKKLVIIK